MCGRFVQFSPFPELDREFDLQGAALEVKPSWNVAPTQDVPVVVREDGNRLLICRWGLIPSWSKDPAVGSRMINARAETLAEKPSFKTPFRKNRCLIPADGFYEWKREGKSKIPFYVTMKKGKIMSLAGIFSDWKDPAGVTIRTFAIVTTPANSLLAPLHERMPAIIPREKRDLWLDPDQQDPDALAPLLVPYPSVKMDAWEVSRSVNSPASDSPENIRKTSGQ